VASSSVSTVTLLESRRLFHKYCATFSRSKIQRKAASVGACGISVGGLAFSSSDTFNAEAYIQ